MVYTLNQDIAMYFKTINPRKKSKGKHTGVSLRDLILEDSRITLLNPLEIETTRITTGMQIATTLYDILNEKQREKYEVKGLGKEQIDAIKDFSIQFYEHYLKLKYKKNLTEIEKILLEEYKLYIPSKKIIKNSS